MIQFFAFILFWMSSAQAEEVLVSFYVDDRNEGRLEAPIIRAEGRETALRKTETKDLWLGRLFVSRSDRVTLLIESAGVEQPSVDVSFSDLETGECTLKVTSNAVVMEKGVRQGAEAIASLRLKASSLNRVTPSKGNTLRLLVRLDDGFEANLNEPTVRIQRAGYAAQSLKDNGSSIDDEPNDNIYVAWIEVPAQKNVQLAISDGGFAIGSLSVDLPSGSDSTLMLQLKGGDLFAEKSEEGVSISSKNKENPSNADQIAVKLTVDDRILQRLDQPQIQYDASQFALLRDDGQGGDAEAGDGLYLAEFSVSRGEYMAISLWDNGVKKGALSVFLPSSNSASIRLRTTDDQAGLKLLSEPQSQSQIDSPGASSADGGVDRLAHVLWVAILLFAIGFAARRDGMTSRWEREVAPLAKALEDRLSALKDKEDA